MSEDQLQVCTKCLRSYREVHSCLNTETEEPTIISDNVFIEVEQEPNNAEQDE